MRITDNGVLLTIKQSSERSAIISVFTENHGLYTGYSTINKRCTLQCGNIMHITWSARLQNHLGRIYYELAEVIPAAFFYDYRKTLALSSVTRTLIKSLPEREPKHKIYTALSQLLYSLKASNQWFIDYIKLDLVLLQELGFGLDLSKCPINKSDADLAFISPKTGRAISHSAGFPYKSKLLHLPKLLLNIKKNLSTDEHLEQEFPSCLRVTNHFIYKHFFREFNLAPPIERKLLYQDYINS